MSNYTLETVYDSVGILHDALESPAWFTWDENKIDFRFDPAYRVEMSLKGLGGSAGFRAKEGKAPQLVPGMPVYDMRPETLTSLNFVVQLCIDLIIHYTPVYTEAAEGGSQEFSEKVGKLIFNLGMFMDTILKTRPNLVDANHARYVKNELKNLGFPGY